MDMAPRWAHGYGFLIRHESYGSDTLLSGASKVNNLFDRENDIRITWLEGIYTFRREVRVSVKIPYVDHRRTVIRNGAPVKQSGSGLGDVIIGAPLKRYTNHATGTRNIAFTPSIRLPTGSTPELTRSVTAARIWESAFPQVSKKPICTNITICFFGKMATAIEGSTKATN